MTGEEYVKQAFVTDLSDEGYENVLKRLDDAKTIRMLHAAVGMCTETGEIQDQLKKHLMYGKPLDEVNLVEELGDALWYVALMCTALGVSIEHVMDKNIAKLKLRYGAKFTEAAALERDTAAERKVLES